MSTALSQRLDLLAEWRQALDRRVALLASLLTDLDLLSADDSALASAVRQRLASDRLVVAFVAEFSRGKSELINALFFGDSGRRVMPASPGRTTMCPVELGWAGAEPPMLALLPIDTRLSGQPLATLRERPEQWRRLPLPLNDPTALAQTFEEVTRTARVSMDQARALGFWDDDKPDDNPPCDAQDRVEVPAWRHALINYPHPMLRRGLVVVDTPGLNAIGAEPELTLGLLPSAHATVFVLAADAGVSRSDLTVWREHLGDRACEHFIVLNKIDTLADPLLTSDEIESQIQGQCEQVASVLGVARERVFPLSARQALAARLQGDEAGLAHSRLPQLEHALTAQLLPKRSEVIGRMIDDGVLALQQHALGRLADRRRQATEQLIELRSLRGKSDARMGMMGERVEREAEEFERCTPRLSALRGVMARQLRAVMRNLASETVRDEVARMHAESSVGILHLGAGRAFALLGERLRGLLVTAAAQMHELNLLITGAQQQLNTEFGFALNLPAQPALDRFERELERLQEGYSRYFGLLQVWRLSQRGFLDQLLRMLQSRLRVVFESAAVEVELWGKVVSAQMNDQLRERRRSLLHRRQALARVRSAEEDLERSIAEQQAQDERYRQQAERISAQVDAVRQLAASPPTALAQEPALPAPRLQLVKATSEAASFGMA